MPANTPLGFPYPLGTDRLADGDDAIKNLATAVDTKLGVAASGSGVLSNVSTTATTLAVTFPAGRFTAAPTVLTAQSAGNPTNNNVAVTGVTTTGCTLVAQRFSGTGAVTVTWYAVQLTT